MALLVFDFQSHVSRSANPQFPLLSDVDALRASLDQQGIAGRAISTPPEFLDGEEVERCNERIAMLDGGVFERHRQLKVVVNALALGGLLLAGSVPENLYIDTTGHHPTVLRAAVELFGI